MEERKKFIEDGLAGGRRDVAGLSRTYGISRKTGHKWVQRFMEGGLEGLADRTHARRDRAGRVPAEMERRLAAARIRRGVRRSCAPGWQRRSRARSGRRSRQSGRSCGERS